MKTEKEQETDTRSEREKRAYRFATIQDHKCN